MYDSTSISTHTSTPIVEDTYIKNKSIAYTAKQDGQISRKDQALLTPDWQSQIDWADKAQDTILHLQENFSNVHITVSGDMNADSVKQAAVSLGKGLHLVLSQDFVERMGSSQEEYEKCKSYLTKILTHLSKSGGKQDGAGAYIDKEGVTFWTAKAPEKAPKPSGSKDSFFPGMAESKSIFEQLSASSFSTSKSTKDAKKKDFRIKVKPNYSSAATYAKLAGAGSKVQVKAVIGEAQRNIGALRLAASLGDKKERAKARAALSSYQKLILRGKRKIRRLDEEATVKLRKKLAEKREEQQRAARLRYELNRKRAARYGADRAIAAEGHLDDMNNSWRLRHSDYEDRVTGISGAYSPGMDASLSADAGMGAGVDMSTGFSAADVTVSETYALA